MAVSVVCLAGVVWWVLRQPPPELPTRAPDVAAGLVAVALYALNTVLRADRWQRLLGDVGGRPRFADTLSLTVIGYMGNNVLPARAGDVLRVVIGARCAGLGKRTVAGSLLSERLLDVAVLSVLFVTLAVTLVGGAGLPSGAKAAALAAGALGLAAAALGAAALLRRRGQLDRVLEFLRPVLASARGLRAGHGASMLALTVLIWVVEAGVWGAVGYAVGLDPSALESLYLVALASIFSMIPSGPGYAGTQDAATIIGARAIGGSGAVAVSYLVLVRFVLIVPITVAGAILFAWRYRGFGGWRRARAEASRL